jgi:ATP-dependent RNA helicase DDX19/DBP5
VLEWNHNAHAEEQAAPFNDSNVEKGCGLPDETCAAPSGEGDLSSRPDFGKRGGRDLRPDWRELHGIKSENPEDVERAVDNLVTTLQTVEVKLADKQADVNSPLYSVRSFEQLGLDEALLKGLYAMKFVKPSKVQERALPLLLSNPPQNMIAQSQSGTGKTAAFSLTMLSRVDPDLDAVQVPSRFGNSSKCSCNLS